MKHRSGFLLAAALAWGSFAACSGAGTAEGDAADATLDAPGEAHDVDAAELPAPDADAADPEVGEVVHGRQLVERMTAAALQVGVARRDITPAFEGYTDSNLNLVWDEGEPFDDKNGNHQLDTLYMGGMGLRQPTGVHDQLWVRALALSFAGKVMLLVVIDSLGISIKRMDAIRAALLAGLPAGVDLAAERIWVANTHTHSAPDTLGIFGPEEKLPDGSMKGSYDDAYLKVIVDQCAAAALEALADLKPATLSSTHALCGEGFVVDADEPLHTDPYVGILQARDAATAQPLATLVSVANHPETLWTDDTEISADFPYVLLGRLEAELGGMAFYLSADAGLMQTPAKEGEPGFGRMELIGNRYADAVLAALPSAAPLPADAQVGFGWAEVPVALENVELYAGVKLGIVEGYKDYLYWIKNDPLCGKMGCLDLPLSALRLGDLVTLVAIPGEMVPELVTGDITVPDLGDAVMYPDAPHEPALGPMLATPERFLIGLTNAEVGYLWPKCTHAPTEIYSQRHGPGANAAAIVMPAYARLLEALDQPD
jgi:hypothetical protein